MNAAAAPSWDAWLRREALTWGFILRTVLAMFLALAIALRLDLPGPGSAAVTVSIVALPQTGMVLEKAVYRFLGTLLGAVVTVALVALFGQHEFMFLGAVALWIGLCTAVSTWFRTFRAYAWLLCGYTTCLIGFPAYNDPGQAFDIAVDRVTIVSLGIACAAVVSAVVFPNRVSVSLEQRIRSAVNDCRAFFQAIQGGATPDEVRRSQLRFSVDLGDLEQARMSGVIEDPLTGLKSPRIVALSRLLMMALSRMQLLHRLQCAAVPIDPSRARVRAWSLQILEHQVQETLTSVENLHRGMHSTQAQVGEFFFSRVGMAADPMQALVAGARAASLFLLSVIFSIWADWPDSFIATLFATVLCCVLAAQPNPVASAWQMCLGVVLSFPAAFVCYTWVLPAATGLPMLYLALLPFLVFGAWLMARPGRALMGSGYFMVVLVTLNITGVMQYDIAEQLNAQVSALVGVLLSVLGLAVLSPADPRWRAERLLGRLLATLRMARHGRLRQLHPRFESDVRELTAQLVAAYPGTGMPARDELVATGVLELGAAIVRLRRAPPPQHAADAQELAACLDDTVTVVLGNDAAGYARLDERIALLQERLPLPTEAQIKARLAAVATGADVTQIATGLDLLRVALDSMAEALLDARPGALHAA